MVMSILGLSNLNAISQFQSEHACSTIPVILMFEESSLNVVSVMKSTVELTHGR